MLVQLKTGGLPEAQEPRGVPGPGMPVGLVRLHAAADCSNYLLLGNWMNTAASTLAQVHVLITRFKFLYRCACLWNKQGPSFSAGERMNDMRDVFLIFPERQCVVKSSHADGPHLYTRCVLFLWVCLTGFSKSTVPLLHFSHGRWYLLTYWLQQARMPMSLENGNDLYIRSWRVYLGFVLF